MELADRSCTADTSVAPVKSGVVSRRALSGRIGAAGRVIVVSAPAGSGKTFLLRSWISEAGLADRAAWVSVPREERDPQRFWLSVADAVRATAAASSLVRSLTAAPGLDSWAIVERLLADLQPLGDPFWLVIDDLDELCAAEALRQLELLVMRAPANLRFVFATRQELRLGLHRLRLEGELTELRGIDLDFTRAEARALFEAAGVTLSGSALARLHSRTEGWAAGLRLAALSLAGHPDPDQFAAEFSGSERTVAEYLLAERGRLLKFAQVDVLTALGLAGLVNMAMLAVAARAFHTPALSGLATIGQAHAELGKQAGGIAALAFAGALLASGASSSSVGTYAGQVVMAGFTNLRVPLTARRAITMLPALIILATGTNATSALVLSQVVLSFGIPFALVPLVVLTSKSSVMGRHVNRRRTVICAIACVAVIIALNALIVFQQFAAA